MDVLDDGDSISSGFILERRLKLKHLLEAGPGGQGEAEQNFRHAADVKQRDVSVT